MKGLYFDGALRYRKDLPEPVPPPGWSKVRVTLAGICNTDLEIVRGYMGFFGIPGHEFVGIVEESGSAALAGKRVVGEINVACGTCPTCAVGRPRHCPGRTVLGIQGLSGAFAEFLVLPDANLHVVPEKISDEAAVFTEPLAACCRILDQVRIAPTDRVLVLGAGKLGLLAAQVLAVSGCELQILVRSAAKARMAESLGIPAVRERAIAGARYDVVVEATGRPEGLRLAMDHVRPLGTIVLKSTYQGVLDEPVARLVVDEVTVVGSRCGPFPPALAMLETGWVKTAPLIEATYPLARGVAAFRRAGRRGVGKCLLIPAEPRRCRS